MTMPEIKGKWVVLDDDAYQRLRDLGTQGETFSDTIRRLAETYKHMIAPDKEDHPTID